MPTGGPWSARTPASRPSRKRLAVSLSVSKNGVVTNDTVRVPPGRASVLYTPSVDDAVDGGHGDLTLSITAGTGYEAHETENSASVPLRDDDGTILEVAPESPVQIQEGEPSALVVSATNTDGTITAAPHLQRLFGDEFDLSVAVKTSAGTATSPQDYGAVDTTVDLDESAATAGEFTFSGDFNLTAVDDGAAEGAETFTYTVSLPADTDPRIVLARATATVTIVGGPLVVLEVTPAEIDEGGEAMVTATVDPVHSGAIVVDLSLDPANTGRVVFRTGATCPAVAGATPATTSTLSFAAGAASATQTRVLCALDNDRSEAPLEIAVVGAINVARTPDAVADDIGVAGPAPLTVNDDDVPEVSIAAPTLAAGPDGYLYENEAKVDVEGGYWTLTREGRLDDALEVDVTVSEMGGGFVNQGRRTLTFTAGLETMKFSPVNQDGNDEPHGTVTVTLEDGAGYAVAEPRAAEVAVRDDDGDLFTFLLEPRGRTGQWDLTVGEGSTAEYAAVALTEAGTFDEAADFVRAKVGFTSFPLRVWNQQSTARFGSDFTQINRTLTFTLAEFAASDDDPERLRLALDVDVRHPRERRRRTRSTTATRIRSTTPRFSPCPSPRPPTPPMPS